MALILNQPIQTSPNSFNFSWNDTVVAPMASSYGIRIDSNIIYVLARPITIPVTVYNSINLTGFKPGIHTADIISFESNGTAIGASNIVTFTSSPSSNYDIITSSTAEGMTNKINMKIQEGWQLYGSMVFIYVNTGIRYAQTIYQPIITTY